MRIRQLLTILEGFNKEVLGGDGDKQDKQKKLEDELQKGKGEVEQSMEKTKKYIPDVIKISQEIEKLKAQSKKGKSGGKNLSQQSPAEIIDDNLETIKSLGEDIYNISKLTSLWEQLQEIGLGSNAAKFEEMCAKGKSFEELSTEVDKQIMRTFMGVGVSKLPYLKKALRWHNDREHCFTVEQLSYCSDLRGLLARTTFTDLDVDGVSSEKEVPHPLHFILDEIYNVRAGSTGKAEVLFSLLLYKGSVRKESGDVGGRGDVSFEDESGNVKHLEVKEGNSQFKYDLSSKNLNDVKKRVKMLLKKIWQGYENKDLPKSLLKRIQSITLDMWHSSFSKDADLKNIESLKTMMGQGDGFIWKDIKGGRDEFFGSVADYFVVVDKGGSEIHFVSKSTAKKGLESVRFDLPNVVKNEMGGKFSISLSDPTQGWLETGDGSDSRKECGWIVGILGKNIYF